jgi:hypothetical protein
LAEPNAGDVGRREQVNLIEGNESIIPEKATMESQSLRISCEQLAAGREHSETEEMGEEKRSKCTNSQRGRESG